MEKIAYRSWPNCYRLQNDLVDLIVTTDVGPRIIRFGFLNGENVFKEYDALVGQTGGDEWRIYGGHRLWHAPEVAPRTYYPDNGPVRIEDHRQFVRLIQPTETTTGIQKEIDLALAPDQARVMVTHRLRNDNLWAVELAPWALTVTPPGGRTIIPFPPRGSHDENLLPTHSITFWAYTDLTDPRYTLGRKYLLLRQDSSVAGPQKIGVRVSDGWVACARHDYLFVKTFTYQPEGNYPDLGVSVESFTDDEMLEVETVAPLVTLQPQATVEYIERWFLFDQVPSPENDAEIDEYVLPKVKQAQESV